MTDQAIITAAVAIWRRGGLVAFPTETVYGLGADATNPAAIARIYAAKQRPLSQPLIVHVADMAALHDWAAVVPAAALRLGRLVWPGPLTLILPKQAWVPEIVTAGQATIGLRIPAHPLAQDLLRAFGGGVAAPSANQFTQISPTTAAAVKAALGDRVDLVVDGGACAVGLESTIIDMSGEQPILLRPGMLSIQAISDYLGVAVQRPAAFSTALPRVPGSHVLHYAPVTETRLLSPAALSLALARLVDQGRSVALLTYVGGVSVVAHPLVYAVRLPGEAGAYAQLLYETLRQLDTRGVDCILIEAVPEAPQWEAIRDRLGKASKTRA